MKKVSKKIQLSNGAIVRRPVDLHRLLNLNYLSLTNKAHLSKTLNLPVLHCNTKMFPDYLALYNQPGDYHRTAMTGVCFYTNDDKFDGIHGIFNAIYYKDKKLLSSYKERFKNVRFIISPDYSQFGDLQLIENFIRLWKARLVTLWFILELDAVVIPSITYISEETFPLFFEGLEQCRVAAFSTKGHIRSADERNLLQAAVRYAADHLPLKAIIVYSVCGNDDTSLSLFEYAIQKGIKVIIPNNSLRERNQGRRSKS